jgi:aminoglycoside phosphotransferase (APT) family kinase protein
VPSGLSRDDATLSAGLGRWIAAQPELVPGAHGGSALHIASLAHAEGGLANETLLLDLGADQPGVVVRIPPLEATFLEYDLAPQVLVQNAVAAAGVPAPSPAVLVEDPQWIGTPFLVMPRVEGRVPGPAPVFDQWLTALPPASQRSIHDGLMDTLADVHAIAWARYALGAVLAQRSLEQTLDYWTNYVEWAGHGDPLPSLVTALRWCRRHIPPEPGGREMALLWGDVRLGNLIIDESLAVHAVLDWDLAGLGPPEMDLGWYFGLEFMMEHLFSRRVPGFPTREEALARYQARSGHTVEFLDWHEVFALVRALAINDRHQRIARPVRRGEDAMGPVLLARMAAAEGESD